MEQLQGSAWASHAVQGLHCFYSPYNQVMKRRLHRFSKKRRPWVPMPVRWVFALVILGVLALPGTLWFVGPETPEQRNEVIRTVAAVIGGAALLVQLWFTRETIRINAQNTAATIQNQKQSQLSSLADRFYKSTEQLGSESADVRIGALYSLERLANDHEDYYLQVIEVICAFIRRRSTAFRADLGSKVEEESAPTSPPDIDTAAQILMRRKHSLGEVEQSGLDLHDAYLTGLSFVKCDFQNADFAGATIMRARFSNCNLAGVQFIEADLRRAAFWNTILIGTDFTRAVLLERAAILYDDILSDPHQQMAVEVSSGTGHRMTIHYERHPEQVPFVQVDPGRYLNQSSWSQAALAGTWFEVRDLSGMEHLTTLQWYSMKTRSDAIVPRLWNPMTMSFQPPDAAPPDQ